MARTTRAELIAHPETPGDACIGLSVSLDRTDDVLTLRYELSGDVALVRLGEGHAERTDRLWQTTCFEAFLRRDGPDYDEYNFAPSGAWAAYHFDGYRRGMRAQDVETPRIGMTRAAKRLVLEAVAVVGTGPLRVGLSAVIETTAGTKSFWALHHAPGKPDFHHPDCFALELPPTNVA